MATPVYGIFEGGGAKGLGHVASLKAAERNDLEFIGTAGASAGALVAALVAVGYRADELFDPTQPASNILSLNGITPISLLDEAEWAIFETAQRRAKYAAVWGAVAGLCGAWLGSRSAVHVARTIKRDGGFFTTENVRERLNGFLRAKLQRHHAHAGRDVVVPARVRFRDMDPAVAPECCALKVIVTDVTHRCLVVLDGSPATADVEVAEAVAASIAIPGVFKPARIPSYRAGDGALFADGGLVSNLPIWVFNEQKLNFEREALPRGRVKVIAFSLGDPPADADGPKPPALRPDGLDYWGAVGRSAIFGGQAVAQRFAADLLPVLVPVCLGVTAFNFTIKQARDAYDGAYLVAATLLTREIRLRPAEIAGSLRDFLRVAENLIATLEPAGAAHALRVSLIQPYSANSFRVTNSLNMDNDPDDRLVFGRLAQGAPVAFNGRGPAYIDFAALRGGGAVTGMTKYEFALVQPSVTSAICLPIFTSPADWAMADATKRSAPVGIVAIDSASSLAKLYSDSPAMQTLALASLDLRGALQP